jgi:RES domain-containing protein
MPQGFRVVYTAESLALASLEVFVHTQSNQIPLVAIRVNLPNDLSIEKVKVEDLPADWQQVSAYSQLQTVGKQWLLAGITPVLKVPSSIIPVEYNYLLNPVHPELKYTLEPPMEFRFDDRMWKP